MHATPPRLAAPWPNAKHGEVYGPTGDRCYLPKQAGLLVGKSDRWARGLVASRAVEGWREQGGHGRIFLKAASFEAYGQREGWWPPVELPTASAESETWELLMRQGRDLEEVRKELALVVVERERLEAENLALKTTRAELYEMIERLARMAKTE